MAKIEEALNSETHQREEAWTRSLAVVKTKETHAAQRRGRGAVVAGYSFMLREPQEIYGSNFGPQNRAKIPENSYCGMMLCKYQCIVLVRPHSNPEDL